MKMFICCLFLILNSNYINAASISENTIKAVLIKRIAGFVNWPEPLKDGCDLCILNDEKFAAEVKGIYAKQTIKGLKVNVIAYQKGVLNTKKRDELEKCDITYIRKTPFKTPKLSQFNKKPILIISENIDDINNGASLTLVLNKRKISIALNEDVFVSSGLKPNYQLLKMAQK